MSDEPFGADRPRNPFTPANGAGQEVATRPITSLGALASAEQQRVLGELQAQIMLAKMNPRDPQQAVDNILRDCSRVTLAKAGQYEYARGGTDIRGPSIKLMEAIARRWGNINSGFKVIHSENGASEVLTYAWDLETGYRDERQFQVQHIRDTRKGPVKLTDERDVYELIANNAQRRKRACLQAVIPADVIEAATEQCNETLAANVDTSVEGLKKMLRAFTEFGVTQQQIEARIQCRLEAISPGQVTQLSRIYTSLKDGMSVPSQWFRASDPVPRPTRPPQQPPAVQQAPATPPPSEPPAPPASSLPGNTAVLSSTGKDHRAPHAGNPGLFSGDEATTDTEDGADVPDTENSFEHVVMDSAGEPIDGEVHLDPLAWAQAFLALWGESPAGSDTHEGLLQHNADALQDARAVSHEADALLDGIEERPQAAEEPVDEEERISSNILMHLPTLQTGAEVIAYSKSQTVLVPIQRWQREGRIGLVASVKSAFSAYLENLRKTNRG